MKMKIYSVRDTRTQAYLKPFFLPNDSVMQRALGDAMQDENSTFCMHPEDYAVYHLGEYDDSTGVITSHEPMHKHNLVDLQGDK